MAATAAGSFLVAYVFQKTGHLETYISFLFLFFRTIRIPEGFLSKAILAVAPLTFGVYLIHDHFLLRDLWVKLWNVETHFNEPYFVLHFLGVVVLVFAVCAAAEWIRKLLAGLICKLKPVRALFGWIGKLDAIFPSKEESFKEAA